MKLFFFFLLQAGSAAAGQKRGFHTVRRVAPRSGRAGLNPSQRRTLYIKQDHAFDMLRKKYVNVSEAAPSNDGFALSISVDRTALSPCIVASPTLDPKTSLALSRKFPFDYLKPDLSIVDAVASYLKLPDAARGKLRHLIHMLWHIFRKNEAFLLETKVVCTPDGMLEVRGARFGFDDAAYKSAGRQEDVHKLRNKKEGVPEEVKAEKQGMVYVKYDLSLKHPFWIWD